MVYYTYPTDIAIQMVPHLVPSVPIRDWYHTTIFANNSFLNNLPPMQQIMSEIQYTIFL